MISCYDQRSIKDIRSELLATNECGIDVVATLIVACEHIAELEDRIKALQEGLGITA